jgi:hypothetical protein
MEGYTAKTWWAVICAALVSLVACAVLAGFPPAVDGKQMPGTIVINHLENRYGPVTFDHALHTGLAGSCGKCHHGHNEKMNATCRECHTLSADKFRASANQGFLPCSGCHTDYSPDTPAMPGLKVALHKKCFECHVGVGELGSSPEGCVKTCHAKK